VLPDPDDLAFAEVAIAGGADALVTGNARHHAPLKGELPARVMSPAGFLDLWRVSQTRTT
jgi:predicted nucleic acid-binding protein